MNTTNTKRIWSKQSQSLVPQGATLTGYDGLTLPGGKKANELSSADLARVLQGAGIPGVSAANGKTANMEIYSRFLGEIHKAAGDKAVADWLATK